MGTQTREVPEAAPLEGKSASASSSRLGPCHKAFPGAEHFWLCIHCDSENHARTTSCDTCGNNRQHWETPVSGDTKASDSTDPYWRCQNCSEDNRAARAQCNNCGRERNQSCEEQIQHPPSTKWKGVGESAWRSAGARETERCTADGASSHASATHWTCPSCHEPNRVSRSQCNNCDRPKEPEETACGPPPQDSIKTSPQTETLSGSAGEDVCEDDESDSGQEQVVLHIYDVFSDDRVQAVNDVFRAVGSGAFHAGVEVIGQEWSYGYTPCHTGIVFCDPMGNTAHRYREAIVMGKTKLSAEQVENLLEEMAKEWPGTDYDLLQHNCCHFCDAFCRRLGVGPLPVWVTNLAVVGANLVAGVSGAATAVNEIVDAAAERAAELDQRYSIMSTVDSFTTREITIDEQYLESRVQSLWTQAAEGWRSIESVGIAAGKAFDEVQRPDSVKKVSSAFGEWWNWGSQTAAEPSSKALTEEGASA